MSKEQNFPQEISAARGLSIGLIFLVMIETFVVHVLLSSWLPMLALILDLVSLSTIVWLVFDVRALKNASVIVSDKELQIDNGLRGSARIERSNIAECKEGTIDAAQPGCISLSPSSSSNVLIELKAPTIARGPFGVKIEARQIGVSLVDPAAFLRAITKG